MSPEIVNIYIDKMINYITELTKTNLLMSAQVTFLERTNASLNDKVAVLEDKITAMEREVAAATSKSKKKLTDEF